MSETIKLVRTCDSCPEQYDAYLGDEKVGYLRLRHGHFRVECPDNGGAWVYQAYPRGDGAFDEGERDYHLTQAAHSIRHWLSQRDQMSETRSEATGDWAEEIAKDIRVKWMQSAFMDGSDFALPAGHLSDIAEALRHA